MHGRPVICSDIGGMAEKVTDGVDGLHFRGGDPEDLARGSNGRPPTRAVAGAAPRDPAVPDDARARGIAS